MIIMSDWAVLFSAESLEDLMKLDTSKQARVMKAIKRYSRNPMSQREGGYGVELKGELAGTLKIKLLKDGLRVVYKVIKETEMMRIVAIGDRADNEVYRIAVDRLIL